MRHRLTAFVLAAAAAGSLAPAASAAYDRPCEGLVDTRCTSSFCGIAEPCAVRDCHVYSNLFGDYNTLLCVGIARQSGGGS